MVLSIIILFVQETNIEIYLGSLHLHYFICAGNDRVAQWTKKSGYIFF